MNDDSSNGSPFHDVGSIFPGDIDLVSVEPSTTVAEALRLMAPNRYSQVPVIGDGRVRGVFSLWSLAYHLMDAPNVSPHDLFVEDAMEQIPDVTVDDPLDRVLEHLNSHDAVLGNRIDASASGPELRQRIERAIGWVYARKNSMIRLRVIETGEAQETCTRVSQGEVHW